MSKGKKDDQGKLRFELIPPVVLHALAYILTMGANKYTPNNWQKLERWRIEGALMRHFNAWRGGEKVDEESGKSHLWHVLCNVAFLIWQEDDELSTKVNVNGEGA